MRAGFIAGNDDIVSHVKQVIDGSMVTGNAGCRYVALQSGSGMRGRVGFALALCRQIVADGLRNGLDVFDSDGGIYAWARCSGRPTGERSPIRAAGTCRSPRCRALCFGKVGVDYVRFSLLKSEDQLREAVRRIAAVLYWSFRNLERWRSGHIHTILRFRFRTNHANECNLIWLTVNSVTMVGDAGFIIEEARGGSDDILYMLSLSLVVIIAILFLSTLFRSKPQQQAHIIERFGVQQGAVPLGIHIRYSVRRPHRHENQCVSTNST